MSGVQEANIGDMGSASLMPLVLTIPVHDHWVLNCRRL